MIIFFKLGFFLSGIVPLFLGVFIYFQNKKEIINKTYLGLSLCCAIWSLGFFMLISSDTFPMAYLWRMFMDIGAVILPAFWMHFLYSMLGLNKTRRKAILFYYFLGIFLIILNMADYIFPGFFVKEITKKYIFNYYPTAGLGYYLFLFVYLTIIPYSFYLLIKNYRKTTGLKAQQIKYLIIASLLGFLGGGTAFLLTFDVPILPYGIIFFALYPVVIAYAMTKHHLFNLKVVTTEIFVSTLSIIVLTRTIIAQNFQEQILNGIFFLLTIIFGILIIKSVLKEVKQREEIEKLAVELGEANERQHGLLHFLSHEVKGFLTKSSWAFSGILDGSYGEIPEELHTLAGQALKDTREGVSTVEGILQAGDYKKGKVHYDMQPFDFKTAVLEVIEKIKYEAEAKNLKFGVHIAKDIDFTIKGDKEHIGKHVIRNLIDNAIKYTLSGSVIVELSKRNGKTLFSVRDTGVGITTEDKARLFTEGGRGKDSTKVNTHSTGYGLFIAKQIVAAHRGRIWAESEGQGKGATFFVELNAN